MSFDEGAIGGGARFASPDSSRFPRAVTLAWSCPERAAGGVDRPSTSEGYSFTLGDVGCPFDWSQRFTLRVHDGPPTRRVSLELDGFPDETVMTNLAEREGRMDLAFHYTRGPLSISGNLIGNDSVLALVDIEEISYEGITICNAGRYQIPAGQ